MAEKQRRPSKSGLPTPLSCPCLSNPPRALPQVSCSVRCLFCKTAIYSFIYVLSAQIRTVGTGNKSPSPVQVLYQGLQGESHAECRPEVTVTLALRWPVYQSEMKISVRCQSGKCWWQAPGPRAEPDRRCEASRPSQPAAQRPQWLGHSSKRSLGKCQLSDQTLLLP